MTDTIFATATPPGVGAIAVIRISGPGTDMALKALTGRDLPAPRAASVRVLKDGAGAPLDEVLVLRFVEGQSFTGESAAELQCHGGRAVVRAVLEALSVLPGLRLAVPGEFTRRALDAGRMDLAQVEGLADLVAAETDLQRRQALRQMGGALSRQIEAWRRDLIRARALLEAVIDFADEEVPEDVTPEVAALLNSVKKSLQAALAGGRAAERVRSGFEVALIGAPNTGKSTLLNAIAGREVAITSEIAGTTRDVIEVAMDLGGMAVTLLDTAGLRDTDDVVEAMGVARARQRAEAADLRVLLDPDGDADRGLMMDGDILVRSKADLSTGRDGVAVSAKTGDGVADLLGLVEGALEGRIGNASELSRLRHRHAVDQTILAIEAAELVISGSGPLEIAAEELRAATSALESVIGRVDAERILDDIFSSFCLGK